MTIAGSHEHCSGKVGNSFLYYVAPVFFAFLLNYSIIPSESSGEYGDQFALYARGGFWSALFAVCFLFFKLRFVSKPAIFVAFLFGALFLFANVGDRSISFSWVLYVLHIILGAFIVHGAVQSSLIFKAIFLRSLDILIAVWVALFVFQVGFFFATGDIVDIHNMIVPYSEQRTEVLGAGFARLGGAHIEPGTYANWLYGLVLLKIFYTRNLFDRITVISMCTIPLCGSFWGFLAFFFYFFSFFIAGGSVRFSSIIWILGAFLILVAIAAQTGVLDNLLLYVLDRSTLDDNSSQAKVQAYDGFLLNLNDYIFYGMSYLYDFCGGCYSPQDAGVFLNSSARVGLLGAVFIFGLIAFYTFCGFGFAGIVLIIPVFFAKWYYWDNVFWLVVFSSMYFFSKKTLIK